MRCFRVSRQARFRARRKSAQWRSSTSSKPVKRGLYGGALGYIDFSGTMDTCIVIRTIVYHDGTAFVQAGAGIVADSVP